MNARRPRRAEPRPLREIYEELSRPPARIDFTGPIMTRLGMPPAGRACRRRRRWMARGALGATLGLALGIGLHVQGRIVAARLPGGPTIPAALRQDLSRHHETITATVQTIQRLAPRVGEPAPGGPLDDEPDGGPEPAMEESPQAGQV